MFPLLAYLPAMMSMMNSSGGGSGGSAGGNSGGGGLSGGGQSPTNSGAGGGWMSALGGLSGGGGGGGFVPPHQAGMAGILQGLFGRSGEPYKEAFEAYKPYMDEAKGYFDPYQKAGTAAIDPYRGRIDEMKDPTAYMNKIMGGYQESPFAKFQIEQGIKASNNAASASGMLGSGAQQKGIADYTQGIASRDQQQYFQNNMGVNNQYLQGLQYLMGQGMSASQAMAAIQAQLGESAGKAAFGEEQGKTNDRNSLIGGITKFL